MGRFDGKTEKATPRRRTEARKEGQVARSTEVSVAASLIVALLVLRIIAPASADVFRDRSLLLFTSLGTELPVDALKKALADIFLAVIVPFLAVALIAGLAGNIAQVGLKVTPKAARPKLEKVSPKAGIRRLAPSKAGWELFRTAVKLGLLAIAVWGPITDYIATMGRARPLVDGIGVTLDTVFAMLWRTILVAVAIAGVDYGYQKWQHERELRMSKEDVKRERKDQEGDPRIKAVRRRRQQELSRNRMLASIATADVVVTNPTHLAIALRYGPDDPAPVVVAKGADALAKKIREQAYRHGVMVIENKPVARALYRQVKLGGFVPTDLYDAVAIVIATVYRRRQRRQQLRQAMA